MTTTEESNNLQQPPSSAFFGVYDLCVVGSGMCGSAAAHHAVSYTRQNKKPYKVCVIGPHEKQETNDRSIWGAHYDEGRITRMSDPDWVWSVLAQRSVQRYRQLERKTGIQFYNEIGSLCVGREYIAIVKKVAKDNGIPVETLDKQQLRVTFPFLNFGDDDVAIYERVNAGHISPRKLVRAQLIAAIEYGCDVIREIAKQVTEDKMDNGTTIMKVETDSGRIIHAKKVLVAVGAFSECRNLLPVEPDLIFSPQTVTLVQITPEDAQRIQSMPSVIYRGKGASNWPEGALANKEGNVGYYMLPPIQYEDGNYYIKMGHWDELLKGYLSSAKEVQEWFQGDGDIDLGKHLEQAIINVVKDIKVLGVHTDRCVTTKTPTKWPYIDLITPHLGVMLGGNGRAGKSSDECGRLAAHMMVDGCWKDEELAWKDFKLIKK